jgi:hypothetical protein
LLITDDEWQITQTKVYIGGIDGECFVENFYSMGLLKAKMDKMAECDDRE